MNEVNDRIADLKGRTQELFDGDELYDASRENEYLIKCLYGVDINAESVEISKLSLWLRTLSTDKPLTNLDDNIKAGDSITEFNFEEEFAEVFAHGGFDVVIGNPPYVESGKIKGIKNVLEEKYTIYMGTADLYCYFYELGIKLLKTKGMLGFITSNKWLRANYGKNIRGLLNSYYIIEIEDHNGEKIFADAAVDTNIIILKKIQKKNPEVNIILTKDKKEFKTNQENFGEDGFLFLDNRLLKIREKIEEKGKVLKDWDIEINYGVKTGLNDAFIIDKDKYDELVKEDRKNKEILVPLLRGRDIGRYEVNYADLYLVNTHNGYKKDGGVIPGINIDNYPALKEHLASFEPRLSARGDKGKTPYNLRNCAYVEEFKKEKIMYGETVSGASFSYDNGRYYIDKTAFIMLGEKLKYLLAMLNSKFIECSFRKFYAGIVLNNKGYQYNKEYLRRLPIIYPTPQQEEYLTTLADVMLEAKERLAKLSKMLELATKSKDYEQQIDLKEKISDLEEKILDIDYQIDSYIYSMYDITEEERKLIEG